MKFLSIERINHGGYEIKAGDFKERFYGYSKKNAIKQFRINNDLQHKHFTIIEL